MQKAILNLFILLFIPVSFIAQIYVPYRIGNKFGISDENGKMIIPAQFDKIDLGHKNDFIGFNFSDGGIKTSYILNNKIIIKDSDFTYFTNENDFVIGEMIKDRQSFMISKGSPDYVTQSLYDKNGQQLLNKAYNNIIIINENAKGEKALKETVLFLLYSSQNRYALYQFHKKQKKIIKTFFENSYDVDTNYDKFPNSFSIIYQDSNKMKKNLTIDFENGIIKSIKTEELERGNNNYQERSYNRSTYPPPPQEGVKVPSIKPSVPENAIDQMIYADSFQKDANPETLTLTKKSASFEYAYLKRQDDKTGYFLTKENKWLIPPKYDEIIIAEGHGVFQSGFVLKTGESYQFLLLSNQKEEFITPPLQFFPLYEKRNYGRNGFHLFKLFDKDNKFFCYANQDGIIYYKQ